MTRDDFNDILWGDHPDYKIVEEPSVYRQSRWSVFKTAVAQHIPTGKFYQLDWGEGATEYQDGQCEPAYITEAKPVVVTKTVYNTVKGTQKEVTDDDT